MGFCGKRWSCETEAGTNWGQRDASEWGITLLSCKIGLPGLSTEAGVVHSGGNSGYQAINLAYHLGASRVILLGFDMQWHGGKSHFFGDHPQGLNNVRPDRFVAAFRTINPADYGMEIFNCSDNTAMDAFPVCSLEDVL